MMTLPYSDPGYPYEQLTPAQIANVQRLRDQILSNYHHENIRLTNELAYTTERLNQALDLLKEMGADLDVMLATKIVFAEKPKPRHCECDIDDHKIGCQCRGALMIPTKSRRWGQKGLPKK